MKRFFFTTAGVTSFYTLRAWRQSTVPAKCDAKSNMQPSFEQKPIDTKNIMMALENGDVKLRKYWIEPKCGVPFPERMVTAVSTWSGERLEELSFLCGGLRCMLGDSTLCDLQPHTRVYAFGLYVPPREIPTGLSFRNAILKMNKYQGTRTIRLLVIIPKDGIHWSRGFFKSISRHARSREYDYNKKRTKLAHKEIINFCELFANLGLIVAGTEFHLTWSPKGLILFMDGKNIGAIKNVDAIESIFKVFFNVTDNSMQKSVNHLVAVQAQKMWNLREKSPGAFFHQPVVECPIFDAAKQPSSDPCFLRGNQYTLLSSCGFDVGRSKWRHKQSDSDKRMHEKENDFIGEWETYDG